MNAQSSLRYRSRWGTALLITPLLVAALGFLLLLSLGTKIPIWLQTAWFISAGLSWIRALPKGPGADNRFMRRGKPGSHRSLQEWATSRIRFLLLLFLLLVVAVSSRWGDWLSIAAQSVVVFLAIKNLELRTQRDLYQIVALVLVGMGISAWLHVDLIFGLELLLAFWLSLAALLWQSLADVRSAFATAEAMRYLRQLLGLSAVFFLAVLPLSIILFLLLPRTPHPLWTPGPPRGSATIGFSPILDPKSITQLKSSSGIAFRARISPNPPTSQALYWVGAILWRDRAGQWIPDPPQPIRAQRPNLFWVTRNPQAIRQTIVMNRGEDRYLFSLQTPWYWSVPVPITARMDGVLRLQHRQDGPLRYRVWSLPSSLPSQTKTLPLAERRAALQTPQSTQRSIVRLAHRFRRNTAQQTIAALMHWFATDHFRYSLRAPSRFPSGQSIAQFLLYTHQGFCEDYAGGLALLLRLDGVPARIVIGYHGGVYNPIGNFWTIRQNMAHSWVQAWVKGKGWILLDATPAAIRTDAESSRRPSVTPVSTAHHPRRSASWHTRAQEIWSWMQWEWLNLVIDMTPEKQRMLWLSIGTQAVSLWHAGISIHWKGLWTEICKDFSVQKLSGTEKAAVGSFLALLFLFLLYLWRRSRAAHKKNNSLQRWRQKAAWELRRLGGRSDQPGKEMPFLLSMQHKYGNEARQFSQWYYEQRYGEMPTRSKARRLHEVSTLILKKKKRIE